MLASADTIDVVQKAMAEYDIKVSVIDPVIQLPSVPISTNQLGHGLNKRLIIA